MEFKCGNISVEDEDHHGQPKQVTIAVTVKKVLDIVLVDRRMKVEEINRISIGRVHHILQYVCTYIELGMFKLSAVFIECRFKT